MTRFFPGRHAGAVAAVTGGGSGIGRACCERLAAEGASIAVLDRDLASAEATAAQIVDKGGIARAFHCDVSITASVDAAFSAIHRAFDRLDLAVNCAGVSGANQPIASTSDEIWARIMAVNLTGVFTCMRAQYPLLKAAGGGAIVNLASILGTVGFAEEAPYVAAKHGVIGLTRSAALTWGRDMIRVTAVCPTFVDTPMMALASADDWQGLTAMHPIANLPTPSDIAAMVAYLGSGEARSITGSIHMIDAGYTAG